MDALGSCLESRTTAREALYKKLRSKLVRSSLLDRTLVSFQANRDLPFYGWLKYKEAFSAELVAYIISELTDSSGVLLDPFAGTGTALFGARQMGWDTIGIEVLPLGFFAIEARLAADRLRPRLVKKELEKLDKVNWEDYFDSALKLRHIPITEGAFPKKTERLITGYRGYCGQIKDPNLRKVFDLACLAILESVSYTRKDGQYLRWDHRAGKTRSRGKFTKGKIADFDTAVKQKLREIYGDLSGNRKMAQGLFDQSIGDATRGTLDLRRGSCLEILPELQSESVDLVLTSPPYCNRYDYTRTYALELAYLDIAAEELKALRQDMLSCTVENKTKVAQLQRIYADHGHERVFHDVSRVFARQKALHEVLSILGDLASIGRLNNLNIPNMVRNYFLEMSFVIYELARILRPAGRLVMVNDNVRYGGEEVPVDLILSNIAQAFGMRTNCIWTLAKGKGNSSQQMGAHGRTELRKCVYVWEKA